MEEDPEALACDFAEYYHILDYKALPIPLLETLACGLREDSRSRMRMAGRTDYGSQLILSVIADNLAMLLYSFTKDAEHGRNRPWLFNGDNEESGWKADGYRSMEDFRKAWNRSTREDK